MVAFGSSMRSVDAEVEEDDEEDEEEDDEEDEEDQEEASLLGKVDVAQGGRTIEEEEPPVYGDVEVDEDEKEFLRMRPEFALYSRVTEQEMEERVEVGFCKMRWSRMGNGYGDECGDVLNSNEREEEMMMMYEYVEPNNPQKGELDLRKQVSTNLRTNPRVILPGPRPNLEEAEMAIRKDNLKQVYCSFIKDKCRKDGQQKGDNLTVVQRREFKKVLSKVKKGGCHGGI